MKNDNATQSQKARNSAPKGRSKIAKQTSTESDKSAVDDPKIAINFAKNTPFDNENIARQTFAETLKKRSEEANTLTQRAQEVFSDFTPSRFSSAVLEGPNYLRPDDDLTELQDTIINNGLESIQQSNLNRSMKFVGNEELKKLGTSNANGTRIKLNDLIPYIDSKLPGRQLFVKESVISSCKAEIEAKRRLQEILDSENNTDSPSNDCDSIIETQTSPNEGLSFLDITSDKLVKVNVGLQMSTATSPESQLRYLPDRSKQAGDIECNIETFQLRSGPSDVTSYHDFHNLQIAFQSIWTEMFDGQLGDLGRQLFIEYVKLKQFYGVDDQTDPPISTVDDLKRLLSKIKEYAEQIAPDVPRMPASGTAPSGGGNSTVGTDVAVGATVGATVAAVLSPLFLPVDPITGAIIGAVIALVANSQPIIIDWGQMGLSLRPSGTDFIKVTIEEGVVDQSEVEFVLKSTGKYGKILQIPDGVGNNRKVAQLWVYNNGREDKPEDRISLPAERVNNRQSLVFAKEIFDPTGNFSGGYTNHYSLGNLHRLKPGTRVTFDWIKDHPNSPQPPQTAFPAPWPFPTPDVAPLPPPTPPPQTNGQAVAVADDILGKMSRLYQLLNGLEKLLSETYTFHVFAKDSINFGILVTYRQKWEPVSYQVGDLVSTIPLAPKEIRRYTTKVVTKKTRAVKEIENSLQIRKKDSTDTSRVDAEIVNDATNKTNFTLTSTGTFGGGDIMPWTVSSTQSSTTDQSKTSRQVKKDFRESVLKSAEEYKQEHRIEIDTSESQETETTTFHEIQNPNDELAVTYLFYELQRTYRISEKIHKLTPVILVANDVPSPNQINDAWLLQHDWILKRVILDDSFRPALDYLLTSFVGAEINIRLLQTHVEQQKSLVERQGQQVQLQNQILLRALEDVKTATETTANKVGQQGILDAVKSIFDPAGLIKGDIAGVEASQMMADYTEDTLSRAEKEKARLESQLEVAVSALQVAIDKFSTAVKEHYNRVVEIDRLRLHIKDNILYYMQAIWNHEPPDQRFFRLYNLDVKIYKPNDLSTSVSMSSATSSWGDFSNEMLGKEEVATSLPMPTVSTYTKKLADVADLNNLLGYKGNYMMFPLTENNYLTLHMMQDYLEIGDVITVRDPDEFGNFTLDEIQEFATCVYQNDRELFERNKEQFKKLVIDRLTSSRKEHELVIVPTTSLYIEALVGTHPLLEDFKLIHRALDVKKVQAEVRHAELENIRLASRALKGKDEDPDIEKKIIVETDNKNITVQVDEN
jgi:hypothetical protein